MHFKLNLLFCLFLGCSWGGTGANSRAAEIAGEKPFGLKQRVAWTPGPLTGSPEPPLPFTVEKILGHISWKSPIYLAPEPGTDRLLVVEQGGDNKVTSKILATQHDSTNAPAELLLEMTERLIYGLTFHPGYRTNGHLFVFSNGPWGREDRSNRVSRFTVRLEQKPQVDPASELIILQWRSAGHDGGDLAFGNDGKLYITSGDGTSDSDRWLSAQDVSNLLGGVLRIDVERATKEAPYSVPDDNPFVRLPGARPEIWAYGLRNPWRMSHDPRTGQLWVGNNGQDAWETAHLIRRGENYGWSVYEGSHPFYLNRQRGPTPIVKPTLEHPHSEFRSLTGGVVYWGNSLSELNGFYIYGDYSTGQIWGARHDGKAVVAHRFLADTSLQIAAFGLDQSGNLLVVDLGSGIYRLIPTPQNHARPPFPRQLSQTGLFVSTAAHEPHPGLVPYSVNAPGWADGASAERYLALPAGTNISYKSARGWDLPNGAVVVQTFSMPSNAGLQRIETRLLVRQQNEWTGYSYRWNDDQSDATLIPISGEETVLPWAKGGPRTWRFPSRNECMMCHTRAANYLLGLTELQMNKSHSYGSVVDNQLRAMEHIGFFSLPSRPEKMDSLSDPMDTTVETERRARSYLHANCSGCHVEAGGGNAMMELEFTRERSKMNLISARPQHDTFGISDAMLVAPGAPERSVVLKRLSRRGPGQMPPLGSTQIDEAAVQLFTEWISQMKPERAFVRDWQMDDLLGDLEALPGSRPRAAGKTVFQQAGCNQCHRINGEGTGGAPDLTGIGRRLKPRDLLESIILPSQVISEQFATTEIETRDGEIFSGRIESETEQRIILRSPLAEKPTAIEKAKVARRAVSAVSMMPSGTVNTFQKGEILDLIAYLMRSDDAAALPARDFNRLVAHWSDYADPGYLPFIEQAQPEIVQVGFYGAHFWSLAQTPFGSGYPAHFPVQGHRACADWFAKLNQELHQRNALVVGHFNMKFLVGDPDDPKEGPRGFFQFYRDHWDPAVLGLKPPVDALALLEKDRQGLPISNRSYGIGGMREYWACLNNPHWKSVLKAWVRFAIAQGVDGLIANYFYRHDCHCEHCQSGFRKYLAERFSPEQLQTRFGIKDFPQHQFDEIVAWHEPAKSTPLRREMLRFSQIANKEAFDEVLVHYGRQLKPNLIVAQWNHLGDFNQISGDERSLLPASLWGAHEDYLWYSTGDAANFTDLTEGLLGEGTLQARYIRGAFANKPFTLGKYEQTRIRAAIAELAANGGTPMGFYTSFREPVARDEIVRYYSFLRRFDSLFRNNTSHAEVLLLYPRRAIHEGDLAPLNSFKRLGKQLLDQHVLFDVAPDDLSEIRTSHYQHVITPADSTAGSQDDSARSLSHFDAPSTVRVSASLSAIDSTLDFHFVNYNRVEPLPKRSAGSGIKDEQPVATTPFRAAPILPAGRRARLVEFITPETPDPVRVLFQSQDVRIEFVVPAFLVYGIARVHLL